MAVPNASGHEAFLNRAQIGDLEAGGEVDASKVDDARARVVDVVFGLPLAEGEEHEPAPAGTEGVRAAAARGAGEDAAAPHGVVVVPEKAGSIAGEHDEELLFAGMAVTKAAQTERLDGDVLQPQAG